MENKAKTIVDRNEISNVKKILFLTSESLAVENILSKSAAKYILIIGATINNKASDPSK